MCCREVSFFFLFCFGFFLRWSHRSFYRRIRYFASKVYVKQVTYNELRVFSQRNTILSNPRTLIFATTPCYFVTALIRPDFSVLLTDLNERIR